MTYRAAIVARHRLVQRERRESMRAEAERLARRVAHRFPCRRLYLFGSVAEGRPLSVWSDIDFAVEGLAADRLFDMAGALSAESAYPVDLKPLEALGEAARHAVTRRGVLLVDQG